MFTESGTIFCGTVKNTAGQRSKVVGRKQLGDSLKESVRERRRSANGAGVALAVSAWRCEAGGSWANDDDTGQVCRTYALYSLGA